MKKIMGLLFTLLLITNTVFAFPNEPEGFRELKWGDTIEKFTSYYPEAELLDTQKIKNDISNEITISNIYGVKLKNRTLSNLKLDRRAIYFFNNKKFVGVVLSSIPMKSSFDFMEAEANFIENLIYLYGNPTEKNYDFDSTSSKKYTNYGWNSDNKSIILIKTEKSLLPNRDNRILIMIFDRTSIDILMNGSIDKKDTIKNQGW